MKNKPFYYLFKLCFIVALFGIVSCQNESIDEANEAMESDALTSKKKKNKKANTAAFDLSENCNVTSKTDLYAGQNILVGDVTVSESGGLYTITYNITNSGYCLTSTHLSVVENPEDFPMGGGGNPKNGHFEYSKSHDCVSSYSYEVPTSRGSYIAAHAVVNCVEDTGDVTTALALPGQVDVCVTSKGVSDSYFEIEIAAGNSLSGSMDAWCVDQDASLKKGECFTGDVYSSYGDLPAGKFEKPQNFGAVNWLLNQGFIGTQASPELGNYTFGDIQIATWTLVDDSICRECLHTGPYDPARIEMLVAMSLENKSFIPGCDENILIIIVPTDGKQSIAISIPVVCNEIGDCDETAWGDGCGFPGNNWATYFHYETE